MDAFGIALDMMDAAAGPERAAGMLPKMLPEVGNVYALAGLANDAGHHVVQVVAAGRDQKVVTADGLTILKSGWVGRLGA
jgi:uncharacterized membrane protein